MTLGKEAAGSSSSPANPGIKGISTITLKFYLEPIALIILLLKASITLFFTALFS